MAHELSTRYPNLQKDLFGRVVASRKRRACWKQYMFTKRVRFLTRVINCSCFDHQCCFVRVITTRWQNKWQDTSIPCFQTWQQLNCRLRRSTNRRILCANRYHCFDIWHTTPEIYNCVKYRCSPNFQHIWKSNVTWRFQSFSRNIPTLAKTLIFHHLCHRHQVCCRVLVATLCWPPKRSSDSQKRTLLGRR